MVTVEIFFRTSMQPPTNKRLPVVFHIHMIHILRPTTFMRDGKCSLLHWAPDTGNTRLGVHRAELCFLPSLEITAQ